MSSKIEPSLESIIVRGKYRITGNTFDEIHQILKVELDGFRVKSKIGESGSYIKCTSNTDKEWWNELKNKRNGSATYFSIITIEHIDANNILIEIECRPRMYFKITQMKEKEFSENDLQESLIECKTFAKQIMTLFKSKEVEPISVYPIIPRTEIKGRLINIGLKKIVILLDKAEQYLVQNSFDASLKKSRTAYEKMIDYQMKKRGLKKANNQKNNIEILKSKGFLPAEIAEAFQSYYRCVSNIGVHELSKSPCGMFEAQMGYRLTLTILDYFISKLP